MKYIILADKKDKKVLSLTIECFSDKDKFIKKALLKGVPLKASIDLIESWINKNTILLNPHLSKEEIEEKETGNFTSFKKSYTAPFMINEEPGTKIFLLCLSINCLKKLDRIKGLIKSFEEMTWEEVFYWYSKCSGKNKNKGLKAFRILFD